MSRPVGAMHAVRVGNLADAPWAAPFAHDVATLLDRYVREVVLAHRLCPFLTTPDAGLGAVTIVLDEDLDEARLEEVVTSADSPILHVVFPLYDGPSAPFERFASRVGSRLRSKLGREAPVSAVFHPAMHGETDDPHRLIGLLRHAPHPFVQYVPAHLTEEKGTKIAGAPLGEPSGAEANFARLVRGDGLAPILETIAELHASRPRRPLD